VSSVGYCGAAGALDRGWKAAAAAVDGEQELQQRSGVVESSGKREVSKMGVCKCKSECTESSGTRFKSRRRHSERGQVLASRRRNVEGRG
jgi:hypothetical protein